MQADYYSPRSRMENSYTSASQIKKKKYTLRDHTVTTTMMIIKKWIKINEPKALDFLIMMIKKTWVIYMYSNSQNRGYT